MLHRLRNINLYSPEPVGLVNILIASDKIVAISKDDIQIDSQLLTSDEDYQGKRVIPGFIDGHAHITGGGGEAGFKTKVPPVNLSQYTSAGVTSVVGLLGTDDITRNTSSLIAQVYALREEGISAWCYTGGYHIPLQTLTGSIKKDIVHIEPVIGVGELAISDHRSSQPTFDEIARIVGDAHVAGIMTGKAGIVHFHLGDGSRKLDLIEDLLNKTELPPRSLNPTHCNRNIPLFEQACELTKRGISIDVTAFPKTNSKDEYSAAESFKIFHKKKFDLSKLTISSDGGGCLPQFNQQGELIKLDYGRCSLLSDTFKVLLDEGYPEEQVLLPFTKNVANLLRLSQKGEIKVGNDADLIVLDKDNKIESVMALGKWHKKDSKMLRLGSFE
ncbi:MAG: beta-aspartyl-peptidase [Gammaproteobacteria bacterium]|nr:MAG: beta-aspartyl-peptidase [Gammaproteobacteria bacterium]